MLETITKLLETIGNLDIRVIGLLVIAIAIVAVTLIATGLDR